MTLFVEQFALGILILGDYLEDILVRDFRRAESQSEDSPEEDSLLMAKQQHLKYPGAEN